MTLTVYKELVQRSDEWFAARCGIVTASVAGKLISIGPRDPMSVVCRKCNAASDDPCISLAAKKPTPIKTFHDERTARAAELPPVYTPADNDTSRGVVAGLVAERITGIVEPSFVTDDMFRGIESEPIARDLYSGHHEQAIEVGFMRLDEDGWTLGFSPDGLVGDDGIIEIKAPRAKGHILTILADTVPAHHIAQCQAGLLVSGRKWCDFVSFHGGLPLFVKRVYPDERWFDAIKAACIEFEQKADAMVTDYEQRSARMPKTERLDLEMVI